MSGIVINSVGCFCHFRVRTAIVACVEITVEAREVAAAHLDADAVTLLEDIAGGPEIDREFVGFTWFKRYGLRG